MNTIPLLEPLEADLERVEQKMHEAMHPDYPQLTAVLRLLLDSGGKRLRPALALLAGSFYPADLGKLVSLAASVEMLHTATLVHDDLIDGALLRRGGRTLNAQWSPGATVLTGPVADQAALHGLLAKVRDLGVPLVSVTQLDPCDGRTR